MPRNVRPSYIHVDIDGLKVADGKEHNFASGPRRIDGQMFAQFYVRSDGDVEKSVSVSTYAKPEDNIHVLVVRGPNDETIYRIETNLNITPATKMVAKFQKAGPSS